MRTEKYANDKDVGDQDWRRLCQLVSNESDPRRLSELVEQLIETLDARQQALRDKTASSASRVDQSRSST